MKPKILQLKKCTLLLTLLLFFTVGWGVNAMGQATVYTDKDDYAPGEWVHITGSGWHPNEWVELTIIQIGPFNPGYEHGSWDTQADTNGNIDTDWLVTLDELGTELHLQAFGTESGYYAEAFFTDAPNLTSLTPDLGSTLGGYTIDVGGNGFAQNATSITVNFGDISVPANRQSNSGRVWACRISLTRATSAIDGKAPAETCGAQYDNSYSNRGSG